MMLDIARRAINSHSYEELQRACEHDRCIKISDDLIRMVVNELGSIVYEYDKEECQKAEQLHKAGNTVTQEEGSNRRHGGVLYIEMDGAMFRRMTLLGARISLVLYFDIVSHKTASGKEAHKILSREFISYVGDADIQSAPLCSCHASWS